MKLWTYLQLKTKVEQDLGTEDEFFVVPSEILGYFNEAIDQAEQEVLTLYEDYFLARSTLTMVSGEDEYDLPDDIYAHKIRRVVFNRNSEIYEVRRLRDWKKFEQLAQTAQYGASSAYEYMLINESAGQATLLLSPPARESGDYITIWHIRNANVLEENDDILDIPESANFVMQYVKNRIYEKEGHISLGKGIADLERERELLKSSLSSMVPDANNEIEMDRSSYEEMS